MVSEAHSWEQGASSDSPTARYPRKRTPPQAASTSSMSTNMQREKTEEEKGTRILNGEATFELLVICSLVC